ncbi:MAG: SurA N-terminal domain-containing protein, partial [Caulobacteraceae bacterium]
MTGALRSTARNPVAIALMGLLILVFLILGVGGGSRFPDLLAGSHGDAVVAAGSHAMNPRDFRRIFEQEQQRFEQQAGQPVPTEILIKNGFDAQLLTAIAGDEAESEMLKRAGISPAPEVVAGEIKKLPFAFNRVTGKFDEAQFAQFLAQQGLTPREAQEEIADELAQRHFDLALQAGYRLPSTYAALEALVALENRDVSYFLLDPRSAPAPPAPTDAQLLAFMNEHAAQLRLPESRLFSLVRFSAAALAPTIKIDPADVAKEFAARKDTLSVPERRSLVQIPVRSAAQATEAQTRLGRGDAPAAIAKSFGVEPVSYEATAQSAIADRKIAAAAFTMTAGQVSAPVQGDLGVSVLKLIKVFPSAPATLETAKAQLETDLRTRAARDAAFKASQTFDDARQGGASLADSARKAGAAVVTMGPVTKDGQDVDGKPVAGLSPKILKSVYSHAQGQDSDLEDGGEGEYFAIHV